jgi:hypothetical protein
MSAPVAGIHVFICRSGKMRMTPALGPAQLGIIKDQRKSGILDLR